jgi:hypothetical protein
MKKFLQFALTASPYSTTSPGKCLVGLDGIANMQPGSTSTLLIYYISGSAAYKTTITFAADSTYATHYAIMQSVSDAMVSASMPGGVYVVPTLPNGNAITTIVYA